MAKQLNIFLENRPGRLASVTEILFKNGINIRAVTIQDRGDFGLVKLLVDKPDDAYVAFSEKGFACALKDVVAIRIDDKPGGLHKLGVAFQKHGVNVLDGYGFVIEPGQTAIWCAQVESVEKIQTVLQQEGFQVLEDHEIYAL
jgi:hypothetical protein